MTDLRTFLTALDLPIKRDEAFINRAMTVFEKNSVTLQEDLVGLEQGIMTDFPVSGPLLFVPSKRPTPVSHPPRRRHRLRRQ